MHYDAVFFDFDGTVADTLQNITDAVNHTMRHFGHRTFAPETVKPRLGWGVDYLIRQLAPEIPEPEVEQLLQFYRPYYAQHTTDNVTPYPGILPLLAQLRRRGLKLAIISNKPDAAIQPFAAGVFRGLVDYAVGELPGVPRKPEPDLLRLAAEHLGVPLSRCLYVGDSEVDLQTAQNAAIDCICVTWGFRTEEALRSSGAATLASTPEALLELITA